MTSQRNLPPRNDLGTRPKRLAVGGAVRGVGFYERLKSRVLIEIELPTDDLFYRPPEHLDTFAPGAVLDARPVEIRAFRHVIEADAWQVKFRSTDVQGAPSWGVATVMVLGDRSSDRRGRCCRTSARSTL